MSLIIDQDSADLCRNRHAYHIEVRSRTRTCFMLLLGKSLESFMYRDEESGRPDTKRSERGRCAYTHTHLEIAQGTAGAWIAAALALMKAPARSVDLKQ